MDKPKIALQKRNKVKYFQPMPIEKFVATIMQDDRDALRHIENWNIEKEEIIAILTKHFRTLGIFSVSPLRHASMIHRNILFQLRFSPELRQRIAKVQEEIERTKARHARRV